MKLLRIVLNGEEHPHYTITKAFEKKFADIKTIWWETIPRNQLNEIVLQTVRESRYDAVFMQLQEGGLLHPNVVKEMSEYCPVFNWTGDVRLDLTAYTEIGNHVTTLFTNYTNVEMLRALNMKSDYLQVGYDHVYYYNKNHERQQYIVFCGNLYTHANFPLTNERVDMVKRLRSEFGVKFKLFGVGWEKVGVQSEGYIGNEQEAHIYNSSLIAVNYSHFNYSKYFSDRMLREMSCGCLVLSHNFQDNHVEFENNKHLVIFNDLDDMVEKCRYYLSNPQTCINMGLEASKYVSENYKWNNFVDRFCKLIKN